MKKKLVLVGGGHAHMMILDNLKSFTDKGINVTVIGPSDYHYYSGMGPGMLGGTYLPEDIRFATKDVVEQQGGVFVQDKVMRIDPEQKQVFTLAGQVVEYDVLSFNAGSFVRVPEHLKDLDNVYSVKPIERLMQAGERLKDLFREKKINLSIVGGGPSSAEVAGNVWQLAKQTGGYMPEINIYAGKSFMGRFPQGVRKRVIATLEKRQIKIDESGYIKDVTGQTVTFEDGRQVETDFIFMALGVTPSSIFNDSGLPVGPDNGLLVNQYLQSVQYPDLFGGGDCIYYRDKPLDKVGVYAVRQNPILLHNVLARLEGRELEAFHPGPDYLLIFNVGGGIGVLKKWWLTFGGRLAFIIKDYVDRKFIKNFQAREKELQKTAVE